MKYKVVITRQAEKDINNLSPAIKRRIKKKLQYFLALPDPLAKAKTLTNSRYGDYRWRIGDYRVVFDVDGERLVLLQVQHRREIYRK